MTLLYSSIVAHIYDFAMRKTERLCLDRWREELLSALDGDVLEIGAGTGVNIPYYPQKINRLILCEPEPSMRKRLVAKLQCFENSAAEISPCAAEQLNVADSSIDYLVSTLVFCSVADLAQAAKEAFRVLKPGGKLILIEHVLAQSDSRIYFWQRVWQPLWRRVACNCHLTRQTSRVLASTGFKLSISDEVMLGAPAIASSLIVGYAQRP